jgi:hypothetical protein
LRRGAALAWPSGSSPGHLGGGSRRGWVGGATRWVSRSRRHRGRGWCWSAVVTDCVESAIGAALFTHTVHMLISAERLQLVADASLSPAGLPALPPAREFLTSAGFGGAAALVAVIIAALIAVFVARAASRRHREHAEQQERHHRDLREDARHAAAVQECRERLAWVVDKGGIEPVAGEGATLGLGPELALTVLQGLVADAERLEDATLAKAATVQLQQFSLVLAQQGGLLAEFARTGSPAADASSSADTQPEDKPAQFAAGGAAEPVAQDAGAPASAVAAGGRRRRR